jgi:hypothetical protein
MAQDPVSAVASWLTPTETPTVGDPLPAAVEAESPHPITLLPFVHDERLDDDHNKQRDFWHVESTGSYWQDNLLGNELAQQALRYIDETSDGGLLRLVVHAMVARGPERWGGIEIGFFEWIEPRLVKSTWRRLFEEPMTEAERRLDATLDRLAAMRDQRRDAAQPMLADESLTASPPEDPVIALIAEGKRLDALAIAADDRGDYSEAHSLEKQQDPIFDQLRQTKPVTLGGAIAMLEHDCAEALIAPVLAGLRDMQSARVRCLHELKRQQTELLDKLAHRTPPEEPDVIGFGDPKEGGAA